MRSKKCYFNSIKVRLERVGNLVVSTTLFRDFNSIKVRLELKYALDEDYETNDFNSIKVRLELLLQVLSLALSSIFQFHKGTIRTFVQPEAPRGLSISIP